VNYDPEGIANPAWIQNMINEDNEKWQADKQYVMKAGGSHTEKIRAVSEDQTHGIITAECEITVRFVTKDETTLTASYAKGSSGGGGGGGGSSSAGTSAKSVITSTAGALPDYVVKGGTWTQGENGQWQYANDHTYTGEWAAIQNPYADTASGQPQYDWFRFDETSVMITGWYRDDDGNIYYLNPVSDGRLGGMITGWYWIAGKCYYFKEESDGTRGSLVKDAVTPDGYQVNELGEWIVDGIVQNKEQ
jgi:glucan-binding YG repeat protein